MAIDPVKPRARFAKNLEILIEMHGLTVIQVAAAAKLVPKQIYNLLNNSHDPRLNGLEKVANVFGLSAWQMLAIDMERKPVENKQVLALLQAFSNADEAGRALIMQTAEMAAQKASK